MINLQTGQAVRMNDFKCPKCNTDIFIVITNGFICKDCKSLVSLGYYNLHKEELKCPEKQSTSSAPTE